MTNRQPSWHHIERDNVAEDSFYEDLTAQFIQEIEVYLSKVTELQRRHGV